MTLGANRARLPGLDQEVVKFQPQHTICFLDEFLDDGKDPGVGQTARDTNRDLKISMFGCDGLQCLGDPSDPPYSGPKNHIFQFHRFREVHRS
jgi:hypothetical protein